MITFVLCPTDHAKLKFSSHRHNVSPTNLKILYDSLIGHLFFSPFLASHLTYVRTYVHLDVRSLQPYVGTTMHNVFIHTCMYIRTYIHVHTYTYIALHLPVPLPVDLRSSSLLSWSSALAASPQSHPATGKTP